MNSTLGILFGVAVIVLLVVIAIAVV